MINAILFDLSGVLYEGDTAIPGALQSVERVQASSLEIRFITNTSRKTRSKLLDDLRILGFKVNPDQVFTAVDAAKSWLQQRGLRPYCLVHENIQGEFSDFDQCDPNAVLMGDAAEAFSYNNLNRAFRLCLGGAPLVGVGYNRYFNSGSQLLLDAGPYIKAIEFAASVEATILGKPSAEFFHQALASTTAAADQALMVGDDVFGDVEGALNAGIQGCLVRTGKYQTGDECKIMGNFHTVDSVVEAVELILGGNC
jgi:HAD superfamily hydrolase (TIGR01458 family)